MEFDLHVVTFDLSSDAKPDFVRKYGFVKAQNLSLNKEFDWNYSRSAVSPYIENVLA